MDKYAGVWSNIKAGLQGLMGLRTMDPRAEKHFKAKNPDWRKFETALDSSTFRKSVLQDPRADKKLRQFTTMQGKIKEHTGESTKVLGSKGDKSYSVQYHKDIKRHTCTCPDFKYKRTFDTRGECKHIKQVKAAGGIKISTIRSFGDEYAAILDRDPDYAWAADSAATRQLRRDRKGDIPIDEVEGRLRTTADEPVLETLYPGGAFTEGLTKERRWETTNSTNE